MIDYIYPTSYKVNKRWDEILVFDWKVSEKKYLSFPFRKFFPHKIPKSDFWFYLYYSESRSEMESYKGKLQNKFHVVEWSVDKYQGDEIFTYIARDYDKVWFLIDEYVKVRRLSGGMLTLDDFKHPEEKKLSSCIRDSISPAICLADLFEVDRYKSIYENQ